MSESKQYTHIKIEVYKDLLDKHSKALTEVEELKRAFRGSEVSYNKAIERVGSLMAEIEQYKISLNMVRTSLEHEIKKLKADKAEMGKMLSEIVDIIHWDGALTDEAITVIKDIKQLITKHKEK